MARPGKSAALVVRLGGRSAVQARFFVGKTLSPSGFVDILAVDLANSLAVDATYDLQVDIVAGGVLSFTGKSSAIVV